MTTVSDDDLVRAAVRGDTAAFATLVTRYSASVRAVAFHIGRDFHASEDVAQETFVIAFRRLSDLKHGSLFGRWILAIARRQAIRAVRGVRPAGPLETAADVVCPPDDPSDLDHLLAEVMRLPERERRLVMLRHLNGHTVAQISQMTGRPIGTVTKQLSRGYARLRERLAEALI